MGCAEPWRVHRVREVHEVARYIALAGAALGGADDLVAEQSVPEDLRIEGERVFGPPFLAGLCAVAPDGLGAQSLRGVVAAR